jgi:hypothetical protein
MATVIETTPNVAGCPVELYVDGSARNLNEGTGLSSVEVAVSGNSINIVYPSTGTEAVMTVSVFRGGGVMPEWTIRFQMIYDLEASNWLVFSGLPTAIPLMIGCLEMVQHYRYLMLHPI